MLKTAVNRRTIPRDDTEVDASIFFHSHFGEGMFSLTSLTAMPKARRSPKKQEGFDPFKYHRSLDPRPEPNILGETVRSLMKTRELNGMELAKEIDISHTSLSLILTGKTRPRDDTLRKLEKRLCKTEPQSRQFWAAAKSEPDYETRSQTPDQRITRLQAQDFLKRRTRKIVFKRNFAKELDEAGIKYAEDYCEGSNSVDFLIDYTVEVSATDDPTIDFYSRRDTANHKC